MAAWRCGSLCRYRPGTTWSSGTGASRRQNTQTPTSFAPTEARTAWLASAPPRRSGPAAATRRRVRGTWPLPSRRRGSPPPGSSTWTDGRPLASLDSWSRREAVLIPGKVSGGELSWKTSIEPVLVAALPSDTWCVAREPVDAPPGASTAAGGAACTTSASDQQRYTLGFEPTTDDRSGRHGAAPPRRRDHLADRA